MQRYGLRAVQSAGAYRGMRVRTETQAVRALAGAGSAFFSSLRGTNEKFSEWSKRGNGVLGLFTAAAAAAAASLATHQLYSPAECAEIKSVHSARSSATVPDRTVSAETPTKENQAAEPSLVSPGIKIEGLPFYTPDEVAKHKTLETGIWVTFKEGVYNITEFVAGHPGGDRILQAAGGSIEPFWELYSIHKQDAVYRMLEEYRIGNTTYTPPQPTSPKENPFANEPARHPALKIHVQKPFIGETPLRVLTQSIITPTEMFFVRHHLPVPNVSEDEYKLEVSGIGITVPLEFTLEELKKNFEPVTITATLQCAGNRRKAMDDAKPLKGLPWGPGAIGTATYTGVRLRDLLLRAGVEINSSGFAKGGVKHVHLEGYDVNPSGKNYAASIPAESALNLEGEVILAYEMNGEPLTRDHGFPVRAIVPGVVAARSVKWLHKIRTSDSESDSFWQAKDYKMFAPYVGFDELDYSKEPSLQDSPVQSAITAPEEGEVVRVKDGNIHLQGYAYSGGGRSIVRVDVSIDGGKTFSPAQLERVEQPYKRAWAWTLWSARLPVPQGYTGALDLVCRAVDHGYNVQPELPESVWNVRGFLNNAWHRVKVHVVSE